MGFRGSGSGSKGSMRMGTFDLVHYQSFEVIQYIYSKLGHNSKTALHKVKQEYLGLGVVFSLHIGTFLLEHVQVILESFGALHSKLDCNSKLAHCTVK